MSGNQLLTVMATSDARRLKPHMEYLAFRQGEILFQVDEPITHIYFPDDGVVSLQILDSDGVVVEAATIGNEGTVGLGGLLADDISYTKQFVQLSGRATRIARGPFLSIVDESSSLRSLLASHSDALRGPRAADGRLQRPAHDQGWRAGS